MPKSAEEKLNLIQNINVDEYSTPCSICSAGDEDAIYLQSKMKEFNIRHIPILEKDKIIGIVSVHDFKNILPNSKVKAFEIMTPNPYTVETGTPLKDVVFYMSEHKISSALVLDKEEQDFLIFTLTDALNALNEILRGGVL